MKRTKTISEIKTDTGYIRKITVDDPFGNCVTVTRVNDTWQYSCYDNYFLSEVFTDEEAATQHFKDSKNLAALFNRRFEQ